MLNPSHLRPRSAIVDAPNHGGFRSEAQCLLDASSSSWLNTLSSVPLGRCRRISLSVFSQVLRGQGPYGSQGMLWHKGPREIAHDV